MCMFCAPQCCRLVVMLSLSVSTVAAVAALSDRALATLLASLVGFLLSQDIFTYFSAVVVALTSKCASLTNVLRTCNRVFSSSYLLFCSFRFEPLSGVKSFVLSLLVSTPKAAFLLGSTLVVLHFSSGAQGREERFARTITGGVLIGLCLLLRLNDALQRVYVLRLFRNPLFPHECSNIKSFQAKRKTLVGFSVPRRLILAYGENSSAASVHTQ